MNLFYIVREVLTDKNIVRSLLLKHTSSIYIQIKKGFGNDQKINLLKAVQCGVVIKGDRHEKLKIGKSLKSNLIQSEIQAALPARRTPTETVTSSESLPVKTRYAFVKSN
ncbi:hypothetical protein MAR_029739, partial [Mya arenaria]